MPERNSQSTGKALELALDKHSGEAGQRQAADGKIARGKSVTAVARNGRVAALEIDAHSERQEAVQPNAYVAIPSHGVNPFGLHRNNSVLLFERDARSKPRVDVVRLDRESAHAVRGGGGRNQTRKTRSESLVGHYRRWDITRRQNCEHNGEDKKRRNEEPQKSANVSSPVRGFARLSYFHHIGRMRETRSRSCCGSAFQTRTALVAVDPRRVVFMPATRTAQAHTFYFVPPEGGGLTPPEPEDEVPPPLEVEEGGEAGLSAGLDSDAPLPESFLAACLYPSLR